MTRLEEVTLLVRDHGAALKFYRDLLELPVLREEAGRAELAAGRVRLAIATAPADAERADCISSLTFVAEGLEDRDEMRRDVQGVEMRLISPARASEVPSLPSPQVQNIDHIVVASGDSASTSSAFESAIGLEIKRTMVRPGTKAQLAFAKLGEVIIEFAGPPEPQPGPISARYWGMVFTVRELDPLVARIREAGLPCSDPRPAVQPGARIAPVKGGTGGVPVAMIEYAANS